jgi:pimeloyl-ACP methyl ester carboxylesterase
MNTNNTNATTVATQHIDINGITYAYRRFGKVSEVPVVGFQHFTGTLDNWDPLILNGLAEEREVIIFDNTGVGNSSGTAPESVEEMTRDAVAFIQALGLTKIDVLGFSLGGLIAQILGQNYPTMIRKIIIVGAAPQGAKVLEDFANLVGRATQKEPAERFLYIFFTESKESRQKGMATLQRLFSRTVDRDKEATQQVVMAQIKAIMRWGSDPVSIDLKKINHPVLIIQGGNDEMMGSDNSYQLFKSFSNAILTYYPDSAHSSFYQYPELFVSQANQFFNKF